MNIKHRILSLLLCIVTLACTVLTAVSCSDTSNDKGKDTSNNNSPVEESGYLSELDYGGKEFRIYTSINAASISFGNSNYLIQGDNEADGSNTVQEKVHARNAITESQLGVTLKFTQVDWGFSDVSTNLESYINSNIDEYDLIINDLYPVVGLSTKNYFINVKRDDVENYFDFSKNYWYSGYMEDVSLNKDYQFILAGDFFADVIRSAHCLIYNKSLYATTFNKPGDELYSVVSDYEWTYEMWYQLINDAYVSAGGESGEVNVDADTFGFIHPGMWGAMIPMMASAGIDYIKRDADGYPAIDMNDARVSAVAESIYAIMYNQGTAGAGDGSTVKDLPILEEDLFRIFADNRALFVGYQRLGTLENEEYLNIPDANKAIIPYPMFKVEDKKYTTSSHDTTEIGVIPVTINPDPATFTYISAVIEKLCAETGELVMPEYYETSLKVKYASDENAGAMIDIIHDNFGNVFQLAYDVTLGNLCKSTLFDNIKNGNSTVTSALSKTRKGASNELKLIISDFKKTQGISD